MQCNKKNLKKKQRTKKCDTAYLMSTWVKVLFIVMLIVVLEIDFLFRPL